jgi:hypothetical protein
VVHSGAYNISLINNKTNGNRNKPLHVKSTKVRSKSSSMIVRSTTNKVVTLEFGPIVTSTKRNL